MKRLVLLLASAPLVGLLSGCGSGEVVIHAQIAGETPEAVPVALRDLPIRLLPYDRDVVFDSLEAAYPVPEPQIPDSLLELQTALAQAQEEWQAAELRWNEVRDSLRTLNNALSGLSRADPEYVARFRDFQDLEPEEPRQRRRMDAAFERFNTLQRTLISEAEQLRIRRQEWEDEAFNSVEEVIAARLDELGRQEYADTTDNTGVVRFRARAGRWWVTTRFDLPFQELYWNVPVELLRGEPIELRLSRENAQIRPKL